MRTRCSPALLLLLLTGPAWADGGLTINPEQTPWPRWQARVGLSTTSPLRSELGLGSGQLQGGRLLGDYYFVNSPSFGLAGVSGGFRATSGLLLSPRGPSLSMATVPAPGGSLSVSQQTSSSDLSGDPSRTVPYLGFGYTGLSAKGGWGITADVGVMALNPGSGLRLGRGQSLDDVVRDMRLTPVLQLGVSYSF